MQPMTQTEVTSGPPIPPAARVHLMDDKAFEVLVQNWMGRVAPQYLGVERFGGPGDMGRDVIGWTTPQKCVGVWDNVQCKHLNRSLSPGDLWPEIGKVLWHASKGDYSLPRSMKFLASKGVGTGAKHLLTNPDALKKGLIENWAKNVEHEIAATAVPLDGTLKTFVENAPFEIFGPLAIEDVLTALVGTSYYVQQFGGGLPARPPSAAPPASPLAHEDRYVMQLFAVYAERRGAAAVDLTSLDAEPRDRRHFDMCRQQFYCAESLKEFARDATRPGTFEGFQQDVLSAITPLLYDEHGGAFNLVNIVLRTAALMPSAANALYTVVDTRDKQGACHQLVNDGTIDWV